MSGDVEAYQSTEAIAGRYGYSIESVRRWIVEGLLVAGHRVHLDAIRIGRNWRVLPSAMERFVAHFNGGKVRETPVDPKARKRRDKEDREYLESMGVG